METERPVDPSETRRFFDEKARRRGEALDERFAAATEEARSIIAMIARDFRPLRIWQWGSLLDRCRFSEISDIDIAVEGIVDTATFFELYGCAAELATFPLDLVELERIEPLHAESIRLGGRCVYERP
jgi:predicted nucleotidyltransferase